MDMYREQLLEHYHHPRGRGLVAQADVQEEVYSQVCGDALTVQLLLSGDMVTEFHFEGNGCAISIAAASLLGEHVVGKHVSEVLGLQLPTIESMLGVKLSPVRIQCGLLALKAVQRGLTV